MSDKKPWTTDPKTGKATNASETNIVEFPDQQAYQEQLLDEASQWIVRFEADNDPTPRI